MRDENLLLLRNAIIGQAVKDYKTCVIKRETRTIYFREIVAFFESGYCAALLGNSSITGERILEMLDKWHEQVKKAKKIKRPRNTWMN